MSTASLLPATARSNRKFSLRRLAAWLVAGACNPKAGLWLVIGFATAHAVLWTLILVNLKAAQDVHMDVAEAFGWGQKFQFGYGKHPPLSGWIAGLWFKLFPVADWATYALAMTVVSCGIVISWLTALRVVDRRRAFLVVAMIPHLIWLKQVDFVPLTYAGDVYGLQSRTQNIQLVIGYILHNIGLLAVPVALTSLAMACSPIMLHRPSAIFARTWSRGP